MSFSREQIIWGEYWLTKRLADPESGIHTILVNGEPVVVGLCPKVSLQTNTQQVISVTQTPTKLSIFDTLIVGRGGVVANPVMDEIAVSDTFTYEYKYAINVIFKQTEELVAQFYINGLPSGVEISMQGLGNNKPQMFTWVSTIPLQGGDTVALYVHNGDSGNFDLTVQNAVWEIKLDR